MFVYVYDNKGKDLNGKYLDILINCLNVKKVTYKVLSDAELDGKANADAIFVLGGDGTILWVVEFANRNNIPIVGINVGKLGFLSEFETCDIEQAVELFCNNELSLDNRATLKVSYNNNTFYSLNDVYLQRIYSKESGCMTTDINVSVNGKIAEKFKGDGVVMCSPTGSTAYSLSAGGPIISPDVNAFCITPIAAHAFSQRAIVCNANSMCEICVAGGANANLFVDGRYISEVNKEMNISIEKADNFTSFLRKQDFDFYKRLSEKLKFDYGRN